MFLKIKIAVFAAVLVLIGACGKQVQTPVPYFNGPDFTPYWPQEGDDTSGLHQIGEFAFTNQNGDKVTEADFEGKVYVTNFIFTTCGSICPKMTNHMKMVRDELTEYNDQLMFLSHSVMPWVDSPEKLKSYAEQMEVDKANWHFVTGNKGDLYSIARTEYFIEEEPGYDKDSTEFLHTEHFALIDKNKHIRGIYNGTLELEMEKLIEDIEYVLNE